MRVGPPAGLTTDKMPPVAFTRTAAALAPACFAVLARHSEQKK